MKEGTEMDSNRNGLSTRESIMEAAASLKMEGFQVDEVAVSWCEQVLRNELTKEEYLKRVLAKAGVAA